MAREENTFEDPTVAKEWIAAIESEKGGARDLEIYPYIKNWASKDTFKSILEIGSGQGVCSGELDLNGRKYTGIEPSLPLVERARTLYTEPNKSFVQATAYNTTVSNNSVDAVFSVGVWFHIKDLDLAHMEINRILKVGGEFLIVTANPDGYNIWKSRLTPTETEGNRITGELILPTGKLSRNTYYLHTENEIITSLENNGFKILKIDKKGKSSTGDHTHPIWILITVCKL
jgi:SAM-dependent methyltransferase